MTMEYGDKPAVMSGNQVIEDEGGDDGSSEEMAGVGVEQRMLARMATDFAFTGEVIDESQMMRPGLCIPTSLFKDPNSEIPFRRGNFLVKATFVPGVGGAPGKLRFLPQDWEVGTQGKGGAGADSGWGDFQGGKLTRAQTNLGDNGSLAYARNWVFSARGLAIYSERPFTADPELASPNFAPQDAPWVAPYISEIMEALHRNAVLSVRAAFGTCDYELDKLAMWNAMGGLQFSDTPQNSQGIARNMMKFQCPIISGTRDDDDKLIFILTIPEVPDDTETEIVENGDVPFENHVWIPVSIVIPGRQFCRPWDDNTCQAPGVRDARRRIKRIEDKVGISAKAAGRARR